MTNISSTKRRIGVIFGKFFPLHKGHLSVFDFARTQVDKLYIFCCTDEQRDYRLFCDSSLVCGFDREERTNAVRFAMMQYDNVEVHNLREDNIPSYPNGWQEWANVVKKHFADLDEQPTVVFTSEPQDAKPYKDYLDLEAFLVDPDRDFISTSGTECRRKSFTNFDFVSGFLQSRMCLYVKLNYEQLKELAPEEEISQRLNAFARNYNLSFMPKKSFKEHKHLTLTKAAIAVGQEAMGALIASMAELSYGNLLASVRSASLEGEGLKPIFNPVDDYKLTSYKYQAQYLEEKALAAQAAQALNSGSGQQVLKVKDIDNETVFNHLESLEGLNSIYSDDNEQSSQALEKVNKAYQAYQAQLEKHNRYSQEVRDLQQTFHTNRILPLTIDLVLDKNSPESLELAQAGEAAYRKAAQEANKEAQFAVVHAEEDIDHLPHVNVKFPGYLQVEIKSIEDLEITLLKAVTSTINTLELPTKDFNK